MSTSTQNQPVLAPLGSVEPHAYLLKVPLNGQLLYKVMTVENLLQSIKGNYIHFNRVDTYTDLPSAAPHADPHDGRQLPKDQLGNERVKFEKSPDFSIADYYDKSRSRTYACCLSLENSNYIWEHYGNGSVKGKVCIVFAFEKMRAMINQTLQPGNASLEYKGLRCHQFFSVNYGIIDYVEWDTHQANTSHLPNPIAYTYLKAKRFKDEKEFRVSLSTIGMGHFVLKDGSEIEFPPSLQMGFDFRAAIANGTIREILCAPDSSFIETELQKFNIMKAAV